MMPTLANIAVPVFFPHPVVALLALLPVVGTEYLVLRRVSIGLRQVFTANLVSALLGFPVAMICLMALSDGFNVYLSSHNISITTVLLVAAAVLAPCFVLSVVVEGILLRRYAGAVSGRGFWTALIKAHYYSYIVLISLDCVWLSLKLW